MNIPPAIAAYENSILGWIKDSVGQGLALLKKEKGYMEMENAKKFLNGEQFPLRSRAISRITNNRLRKIAMESVGALTDVRQIWNYSTNDPRYKAQGEVLSKLARAWWRNGRVDRKLQSVLLFALAGGSGYGYVQWNPELPGGGDFELLPLDPRDVLPIEPTYSDSVQDWRGVIIRRALPTEVIRHKYPLQAAKIGRTKGSWVAPMTKEGGGLYNVVSAAWTTLTRGTEGKSPEPAGLTDLYYIYVKDNAINSGTEPVLMGPPGREYSYTVYPVGFPNPLTGKPTTEDEARLYPRGRLIVATMDAVCEDGPNPNWHGLFPVVRFTLEPLPWSLLGASIIGDLIPLQNALNEALRGLEDGMSQWIRRGIIADRQSMSKANLDAMDTRKAGMRAYLNNNAGGQGFQIVNGPEFPAWYMEMLQYFENAMDENSGVRGLKELQQLKQMPSADTLDKYMEALSPVLKVRARILEESLGEVAEMLKVGFLQKYDVKRRVEIIGVDGAVVEDFDYDPGVMVPSDVDGESRMDRALNFHRNFKFSVTPNSFLNVSHTEKKMLTLQMFREGIADPWTLWEDMDINNVGEPPAENIEERIMAARKMGLVQGPTEELMALQNEVQKIELMLKLMQLQQQAMMMGMPPSVGPDGQPVVAPPAGPGGPGRPPSGAEPPQMVQKTDESGAPRTVVSESGR